MAKFLNKYYDKIYTTLANSSIVKAEMQNLVISFQFIEYWASEYDKRVFAWTHIESEIRKWLDMRGELKYLNKRAFLLICWWKTGWMSNLVRSNHFRTVRKVTSLAFEVESDKRLKLRILQLLNGVDVPIASTILHFLQPAIFPLFDVHVKSSLKKAGKWNRTINDESEDAWLEYVKVMSALSCNLGVGLRDLDKALWIYDRLG